MPTIPDPEQIGPVDVALVLFEGNQFNGDVAPAIAELQNSGIVRIIDLAFVTKAADGSTGYVEATDTEVAEAFAGLADEELDLLSDEDLQGFADALEPNSSALAVVWENTWAARLATAVRDSGGEVVAQIRIPAANVAAALEALRED
ncbi:MAG: DUF6325 family protein [Candidatus Nanopelagicales bacterium]|jgi:uncharacterized membrane protein|nr:DUF6325 family protein [Candidatus Nanopelagicales bacterium]